ncbi:TPA: hypothetical protein HA265_01225 [Candidatus Woesearchaeota archaeon]|nr:hypothetical protein [Candidatus Woesearchaeota archaeon]
MDAASALEELCNVRPPPDLRIYSVPLLGLFLESRRPSDPVYFSRGFTHYPTFIDRLFGGEVHPISHPDEKRKGLMFMNPVELVTRTGTSRITDEAELWIYPPVNVYEYNTPCYAGKDIHVEGNKFGRFVSENIGRSIYLVAREDPRYGFRAVAWGPAL